MTGDTIIRWGKMGYAVLLLMADTYACELCWHKEQQKLLWLDNVDYRSADEEQIGYNGLQMSALCVILSSAFGKSLPLNIELPVEFDKSHFHLER